MANPRRTSARRAAAVGAVLLALACTPATSGRGGQAATGSSTPAPTAAEPSPPGSGPVTDEVRPLQVTITDPVAGELTFDALAAGDPARAATGRLVVLLHGFPETAEAYRDVLPALAGAGYHAVALTQRGYSPGARPADVERYRVVDLGADVLAVATELGRTSSTSSGTTGAAAWPGSSPAPNPSGCGR